MVNVSPDYMKKFHKNLKNNKCFSLIPLFNISSSTKKAENLEEGIPESDYEQDIEKELFKLD